MDDASGHYTTGYLWGNNYWMGSMTLCRSIYGEKLHVRKPTANTGLSFTNEHVPVAQVEDSNPPFIPSYGVLKIVLNEHYTTPSVGLQAITRHTRSIVTHVLT